MTTYENIGGHLVPEPVARALDTIAWLTPVLPATGLRDPLPAARTRARRRMQDRRPGGD